MKMRIVSAVVFFAGIFFSDVVRPTVDLQDAVCTFAALHKKFASENNYSWTTDTNQLRFVDSPLMMTTAIKVALGSCSNEKDLKRYQKHAFIYGPEAVEALVLFPLVDSAVGYGMEKIDKSCPQIAQAIPGTCKRFVAENGRLVLSAAGTSLISIAAREGYDGMNYDNGRNFASKAAIQIGSDLMSHAMMQIVDRENEEVRTVVSLIWAYGIASLLVKNSVERGDNFAQFCASNSIRVREGF